MLELAFELSDLGHGVEFWPISISWLLWVIFWPFLQLAIEMSNFGIFWAPGGRGHCVPGGIWVPWGWVQRLCRRRRRESQWQGHTKRGRLTPTDDNSWFLSYPISEKTRWVDNFWVGLDEQIFVWDINKDERMIKRVHVVLWNTWVDTQWGLGDHHLQNWCRNMSILFKDKDT